MVHSLIDKTVKKYKVKRRDLQGRCRNRQVVEYRMMLYTIMRNDLGYSLKRIGRLFNRDHSSVIHLLNQHAEVMSVDPDYEDRWYEFRCDILETDTRTPDDICLSILGRLEDAKNIKQRVHILKQAISKHGNTEMV